VTHTTTFAAAYGAAFASYLRWGGESSLHVAYQLGRDAVEDGLRVPDLARIHHDALIDAVGRSPAAESERVIHAAADFLAESVSAYEVIRRGFEEARKRADLERRHSAIIRRLTALMADTALVGSTSSLRETLELVAETACELTQAPRCTATVHPFADARTIAVSAGEATAREPSLIAPLTALSGATIGSLRLIGARFTELDEAVLMQLAQMTAASVERYRLYE
jgi:hypothetical protein